MFKFSKKNTNVGILGGTFDPPHKGHLHISKIAIKKFKLNKIIWAVTKKNPLKSKPYFSVKQRISLSKKISKNKKKIFVNYFDDRVRSTNTFNLLNYLKKKNPKKKIFFLIGADNFINFHKWKNWRKISKLAKIVVFARSKYKAKTFKSVASKKLKKGEWVYINSKKINISSSLIRKFW